MIILPPGETESITLPSGPRTVVLELGPSIIRVAGRIALALVHAIKAKAATKA